MATLLADELTKLEALFDLAAELNEQGPPFMDWETRPVPAAFFEALALLDESSLGIKVVDIASLEGFWQSAETLFEMSGYLVELLDGRRAYLEFDDGGGLDKAVPTVSAAIFPEGQHRPVFDKTDYATLCPWYDFTDDAHRLLAFFERWRAARTN